MKDNMIPRVALYIFEKINKHSLFLSIDKFCQKTDIINEEKVMYQALLEREKKGSTMIEEGITMPHIQSQDVKQSTIIVVKTGIEISNWEKSAASINIIVFLLLKENEENEKLKELQSFVRNFADDEVLEKVRNIEDQDELQKFICTL